MVDSRLAEAHRVVMQRTANRYLVNIIFFGLGSGLMKLINPVSIPLL